MGGCFRPVFAGCLLLRQTIKHVTRHTDDDRVVASQPMRPVRTAAGDNGSALRIRAKNGCSNTIFGKPVIPDTVTGSPSSRAGGKDDK